MEEKYFTQPQNGSEVDPLVIAAKDSLAELEALQCRLTEARKISRLLEDLVFFRDRGWFSHIQALCEKEAPILKALRQQEHSAIEPVEQLYRESKAKADRSISNLPADLEKIAKQSNIEIDFSRSRHPKYYFGTDGMIELEINDKKHEARVGTREGSIIRISADVEAIVETVKTEASRLFGRKLPGTRFLTDLRTAYLAVVNTKKGREGDPVPIREVYNSMVTKIKSCKNYKKDEFLVDMSHLVTKGPAETKGVRFELQQTKDTAEGMLLLGAAGRGMVNLLLFKKPESQTP